MKGNTEISESRFLGNISASSIRNLLPKSISIKQRKSVMDRTNSRSDRENTPPVDPNIRVNSSSTLLSKSHAKTESEIVEKAVVKSACPSEVTTPVDPSVKVVVRIRPVNDHQKEGDWTVRKFASDSLCIEDRKFTFDSVLDSKSNQEDIFQLVGVPSVKDALAGYNTSILLYGQTGSGKTYTMWGPPSAMVDDPSPSSDQGIVPRIFQMLFSEIERDQGNVDGKQTSYQCRCSFLEVYNEQIGDLLDPTQRNLQIRDDAKNGFYVENLTEEYVSTYEDVIQILIKGLSSRKVGATSINSKSSRSHIVFTCIVDSWCEGTSSQSFSSSRTSRISFVDLAGMETRTADDSSKQSVMEAKNVKKSLSMLGHLVNILSKEDSSRDIPYKSSCLTHLMRESLGGNAKLTVICAISPDNKSNCETLSTLRFGQRAKSITNKPVINEITEDDVNDLSDQIRQLKEELKRAKSSQTIEISDNGYFKGRNVRDSLNQLRVSLNRSLILPRINGDDDREEAIDVDECDVTELCQQLQNLNNKEDSVYFPAIEESCELDLNSESYMSCAEESEIDESLKTSDLDSRSSISINPSRQFLSLPEPILSESPKIKNSQRNSISISSNFMSNQNKVSESFDYKSCENIRSSLQSSNVYPGPGPTESLAASLHRGLQIIDYHQRNSTSNRSSVSFSFEHMALKSCSVADKARASIQSVLEEKPNSLLCASCRRVTDSDANEEVKKDIEDATKREELEILCKEQAAKIIELNNLVEQYKREIERVSSLDAPKNEIVTFEESNGESKVISQPEIVKEQCEIKEVQEVLEDNESNKTCYDLNEKEALLREIESLRSNLSINKSVGRLRSSLLLSRSLHLQKGDLESQENLEELEKERQRWTEMESDWISLTDDLRIDLQSSRSRAEKLELELKQEKNCTEELNDVVHRSVLGHARMIEHYAELQEKHNELVEKHRMVMVGITEIKKAAAKAGAKGHGARFAKHMAAELSALRVERAKEMEFLKKENKGLKIQLRETAEAVHAAGELLVRLREAEEAASVSEANFTNVDQENEKLKKQMEKMKRKHKMEMVTMKQYLAESRLPESALLPPSSSYHDDSNMGGRHARKNSTAFHDHNDVDDDDQAWRAEFGAIYQDHHY